MKEPNKQSVEEVVEEFGDFVVGLNHTTEFIARGDAEDFARKALQSQRDIAVGEERERILEKIEKMKKGKDESTPFLHGYRTALVVAYNTIR